MAVISVTVTKSSEEIVSGIPKTVSISTNVFASIFYTLDGSIPTLSSNIYIAPIFLPTKDLSVILKIMASNGVDSSPVITETYITNILNNARLPRSATDAPAGTNIPNLYPFGTPPSQPIGNFLNPGDAGVTVYNPDLPAIPSGFDGSGSPDGYTNEPYNIENYNIIYSTKTFNGESGKNIGNLPANVKVIPETPAPETSEQFSNLFNPKAFVIFQDASKENPNDPAVINRMHFSLEDPERSRDGNHFYVSGLDAPPVSGSFLRSYFNPRDNTITYYYYDSIANKWIISKTPFQPSGTWDGDMSSMARAGGGAGGKFVFEWVNFPRRVLF